MVRSYGTVLSIVVLGMMVGAASATPLNNSAVALNAAMDETGLVQHVDVCNRVCRKGPVPEWGGAVRWHRHVGKACKPAKCSP